MKKRCTIKQYEPFKTIDERETYVNDFKIKDKSDT